ncbi:MAG TPA: hypothetical protein VFE32_00110 [Puia sp.]|jgi:hypothetical protein|nr:hypothetical protein [Puia sp.]
MLIKFLVNTLLIALLSFVGGLFLPNWVIAPIAFMVILLIPLRPLPAFLSGFLALFLLWGGLALAASVPNKGILATKIASLLPLNGSPYALILVTAMIGALMGGGGALTASFLKK